jgi:hypothetical protein
MQERGEVILADAGGAAAGSSRYQRVKFEAILQGELAMGLAAHNLGASEVALGADFLREVGSRLHVPFVSANVTDTRGKPLAEPLRIVEKNGVSVALTGVLSQRFATEGVIVEEPRTAILRLLAARSPFGFGGVDLGEKGRCDSLMVLAYMPEDELINLATNLPEADWIIGGPTGQSILPHVLGPTWVASATNKGKFLVHLERPRDTGGRREWSPSIVEVNEKFVDDPDQQANVRRFLTELEKLDLTAQDSGFVSDLPMPKDYRLAGSAACISCHKNDCTSWSGSKHSHAWQTLQAKGYHVDSYCQQCHTTGYGLPGGFESARRSAALTNVGCESCHGPSAAHVRSVKTKTPFAAKDQCDRCHDRENSPQFDYPVYWPKIKHGEPATTGG